MTIKSKLITNVLVTAAIIIGISLSSLFSMSFLQRNLSFLTEKSTPFQMRTVEFQRDLQGSITNLIKVNAAHNMTDYTAFRAEAEASLDNVRKTQEILKKMNADSSPLTVAEELEQTAGELYSASEERIKSDIAAGEANIKISQQMKESSERLKELDTYIRNIQTTHSSAFTKALESTGQLSARLRDLENLRNQLKELLSVSGSAHNASTPTAFLIAQGKMKSLLGRINRNKLNYLLTSDLLTLTADMNEFFQLQSGAIFQKNEDSKTWAFEASQMLAELMNRMNLTLNQEIDLASSKLTIESNRQGHIFTQSIGANNILLTNSELVSLCLEVTGRINRLFNLASPEEIDKNAVEIRSLFNVINERAERLESSLAKLGAGDESLMVHAAHASLEAIRTEINSNTGVVVTLKKKIKAIEEANRSAENLHAIVIKQSAIGSENVSSAQVEQEKLVMEVNRMVRQSLSRVLGIGFAAITVGILFGFWIYRSVLLPLRMVLDAVHSQREQGEEKAALAESIAGGDLDREVTISEAISLDQVHPDKDEMGMLLKAVVVMSKTQVTLDRAFAGMTASLRSSRDDEARRDRLKSGLNELNKILRAGYKTEELGDKTVAFLADFLGSGVGVMYLYDDKHGMLQTLSTYAIARSGRLNEGFRLGEGVAGQVALERKIICLNSIPPNYLPITSALGEADPLNITIMPIMHNETLVGVLELGSFKQYSDDDFVFLNQALEGIAIAISVNRSHQLVNDLLEQTQAQAEELRVQQEELRQTNEELAERARMT